jgi:hypothetical protein
MLYSIRRRRVAGIVPPERAPRRLEQLPAAVDTWWDRREPLAREFEASVKAPRFVDRRL